MFVYFQDYVLFEGFLVVVYGSLAKESPFKPYKKTFYLLGLSHIVVIDRVRLPNDRLMTTALRENVVNQV